MRKLRNRAVIWRRSGEDVAECLIFGGEVCERDSVGVFVVFDLQILVSTIYKGLHSACWKKTHISTSTAIFLGRKIPQRAVLVEVLAL